MNGYGGAVGGLGILQDIANRLGTAWNGTGSCQLLRRRGAASDPAGQLRHATLINGTHKDTKAKDATSPRPAG